MPLPELTALPFDTYQRYRLLADLLGSLPPMGRPLRVLDIGGRTAVLRDFLPEAEVVLVDVEASDAGGLVLGSGCALPFADRSFDAVTACDTLEHVPTELREDFVREACRVSTGWILLVGPYHSERVVEAEELLRIFLREKLAIEHRYLDEHDQRGLPDLPGTVQVLESTGAKVATIGHANLERWLPLMCLSMYLDQDPQLRKVARRYYRFYNEALYASDHGEPVYRHAVVGAMHGAPLPSKETLFAPPGAPPGALAAFEQLAGELVAFDREREVYQAERERLMAVNEGLVAGLEERRNDLAGHREKLAEIVDLNEQQEKVLLDLERDLAGHGDLVRTLRAEIEERIAHQEELEAEVARFAEVARSQNEELVAEHRANLELRADMRSRFRNLKRAFSLRKPTF